MKILIINSKSNFTWEIKKYLENKGHSVKLLILNNFKKKHEGKLPVDKLLKDDQKNNIIYNTDLVIYLFQFKLIKNIKINKENIILSTLFPYKWCSLFKKTKIKRIILGSSLNLYDKYPNNFKIDEQWAPVPSPEDSSLLTLLCENTFREFAREGTVSIVCLRFNLEEIKLDPNIAMNAINKSILLEDKIPGYRWHVYNISNNNRYETRHAKLFLKWDS